MANQWDFKKLWQNFSLLVPLVYLDFYFFILRFSGWVLSHSLTLFSASFSLSSSLFFHRLFFRTVLVSLQNWVENTESSFAPLFHTCRTSFAINIPNQSEVFVSINEPTLIHHYHPKLIVYISIYSWIFYWFWQIYDRDPHYIIIQISTIDSKTPHTFLIWVSQVALVTNFHLEDPMVRVVGQAKVHRVSKSWTRLKRLSTHVLYSSFLPLHPWQSLVLIPSP